MSKQNALVTYAAPQTFLFSESWKQILAALRAQLPLRNIHWKPPSRQSLRTIQELNVDLLPLDAVRGENTSQIPVTLLDKPLLNIFVITCEDPDNYRNVVKKQIKDWLSIVMQRKNQEWLLVQVVRPDAQPRVAGGGGFFAMKGSILDRMKADFNTDKRDRCVQLTWATGQENPVVWVELISKVKEGIIYAFDSSFSQREDEESLCTSYEGVSLCEDALLQYDQLETSFYHVLKEKNLSWFGTLIAPQPKDDSLPLLSISKKPYRDLILANTISVFDFRVYLLSRQCALLARLGRVSEVGKKAGAFLGAFGRRLREIEDTLPEFFVESWIYSSALSVVEQCDTWTQELQPGKPSQDTFNAGKGELLELARNQLDVIGIRVGHLPFRPPFSLAVTHSPMTDVSTKRPTQNISKAELVAAIGDQEAFYALYVALTNRAIDMYVKAGRRKFALKLHATLAALDVHREQLAVALHTYVSLPAHYAPHMWTSLESLMLSQAIDTHAKLNNPKDREWIHITLSYLKTYVEELGNELLLHEDDKVAYVGKLIAEMRNAAQDLESDFAYPDHPAINIGAAGDAQLAETEDGSFLEVTISNKLPCNLPVEEVLVTLSGPDHHRLTYSASTSSLASGKSSLTLFCPSPAFGTFVLESSEVRMSHLQFQWNHRKVGRSSSGSVHLIRIPKDARALSVRLRQPHRIELAANSRLLVVLSAGRNEISKTSIRLSAPSGIIFDYAKASLDGEQTARLSAAQDCISLEGLKSQESVSILLPHSDASAFNAMKVTIEVEYQTVSGSSNIRSSIQRQVVATSLPVAVNVEDFFRGTRLFSKYTISTASHQHVRIASVTLEGPPDGLPGVSIKGCSIPNRGVVTVTPSQPANFLFAIDSSEGAESLSLLIKYRLLREDPALTDKLEVENLIANAVDAALSELPQRNNQRSILTGKLVEALETSASWVDLYGITGQLDVPDIPHSNDVLGPLQRAKEVRSLAANT
ncbi:hypothetical protein HWV62_17458 [Athelia sp. TMB]|nr:hypothetical protein HWV62_17458 [Athelia sp. TMB]